ncbi:hypothetical protein ACE1AT_03825 [Pelatocladus sp. BLCC-F211]|uniref:hypothetical protein n=1 Tax=Pelatocladus sp. BLCC-F211 TaxID=3342752 RepID=UPI0035B771C0
MKVNFYQSITLTSVSLFFAFTPVSAQSSYRITIKNANGVQVGQAFNSSRNMNQLVGSIYQKIKPPGNPRQTITVALGTTNLTKFQNLVRSKGVSTEYYEFPPGGLNFKNFGEQINSSSIRSNSKNYGVVLTKSGYAESNVIPFKVTQIVNNTPVLRFSDSKVVLIDERHISFILNTGNTGLDSNQIANTLHSKDYRLSRSGYRTFEEYQSCQEYIRRNPQVQRGCGQVNFVVNISR